ncbi:hypothetical protein EYF80_001983 [Liparis tanakae]|uniref:Uncharacterized protein n=1 Tax=Liparis tanakae TaxID=230148 RepID=A0A4Z2JBQ6_9TELE|nr:hypothetical protein EYF80_001983 [Liparis tanakae]
MWICTGFFPNAFKPSSYPFHHTQPRSPPLLPTPSFPHSLPSQEARQHEWQAGAGGGIWGLLAKRQTELGVSSHCFRQHFRSTGEGSPKQNTKQNTPLAAHVRRSKEGRLNVQARPPRPRQGSSLDRLQHQTRK